MTKSDQETRKVYATLRIMGDSLDPDQVTRMLRSVPTISYRKGEKYNAGLRSGPLTGKTGVWLLSTDKRVASDNIIYHLQHLVGILMPNGHDAEPITKLKKLLSQTKGLKADVSCFWHGRYGAKRPSIPRTTSDFFKLIPVDIETDFGTDTEEGERRRA